MFNMNKKTNTRKSYFKDNGACPHCKEVMTLVIEETHQDTSDSWQDVSSWVETNRYLTKRGDMNFARDHPHDESLCARMIAQAKAREDGGFRTIEAEITVKCCLNCKHEEEDELFLVIKGTLEIHFRRRISETAESKEEEWVQIVKEGELIVVPKDVEHCPITRAGEEVHVLLFEKLSTAHTGNIKHKKTITNYPKI